MSTHKFRVENLVSSNSNLDCTILNDILELNGVDSETIVQSIDNDNEWIVYITNETNQHKILEKKNYCFEGFYKRMKYSLRFHPFAEDEANVSSEKEVKEENEDVDSGNYFDDFRRENDPNLSVLKKKIDFFESFYKPMKYSPHFHQFAEDEANVSSEKEVKEENEDVDSGNYFDDFRRENYPNLSVLKKKNDFFESFYKPMKYSPHFHQFAEDEANVSSEKEVKEENEDVDSGNYFDDFRRENYPNLSVLKKKIDFFESFYKPMKYSPHFHQFAEDKANVSSEKEENKDVDSGNYFDDFRRENDPNLSDNPPPRWASMMDHVPNEMEQKTPIIDRDPYVDEKTILVQDVPEDLDFNFLKLFLEDYRLSGGGKIQNISKVQNSGDVAVTFESLDVIDEILKNSPLKIGDLTFHISKKVPQQEDEDMESCDPDKKTIEVHGVSPDTDLELVKLYFENSRKSGGGQISNDLIRDNLTGVIQITFVSSEAANRVVYREQHIFNGNIYNVKWHRGSIDKWFFLSDVKAGVMKDSIVNFLESKANVSVEDIAKMDAETLWLVKCTDVVNLIQVQQLCKENMMRFMSETYPKVSCVPLCETIRVRPLQSTQHLDEEKIHLYFEGRIRDDQEIESVEKLSADQFLVTFNDSAVVTEFCFRTHKIFATELEVLPYIKNLQTKTCERYLLDSSLILDLMKKYKMTVEKMLEPDVKPIWPSSVGRALMIEFDRSNSEEEVFKIIENLLENISEETINLSAEEFEMAKELTEKALSNAIVSFDSANETLQIAAFGEDAIVRLKEALRIDPGRTERNVLHLDSYKISLLFANKFMQKIYEKYPGTRFESKRRKLLFQGESSHFPEIKKEIDTYLNDIQRSFVQLPKYAATLLRKNK